MCREMNSTTILANWFDELWCRLESLREVYEFTPKLNIVRVGDRSDTSLYVNSKKKKGKQLQIDVNVLELPESISQVELNVLMASMDVPTILQLPLPEHLDSREAIGHLDPECDVDGLTPHQKGLLVDNDPRAFIPATAKGVMRLVESYVNLRDMRVAIVSRSELIGRPLIQCMLNKDAMPIVIHSKISDMFVREQLREADVIVTGCGGRKLFDHRYFNTFGQVIVDCSMAKVDGIDGVGDCDKDSIMNKTHNTIASGYGHTGPATVMGLMSNVVQYYEMRLNK